LGTTDGEKLLAAGMGIAALLFDFGLWEEMGLSRIKKGQNCPSC